MHDFGSGKSIPALVEVMRVPDADLQVVDVAFAALGNADRRRRAGILALVQLTLSNAPAGVARNPIDQGQ